MKILLTGATGYIGKRLLPVLLAQNHQVVCCVRDLKRFDVSSYNSTKVSAIEIDFLDRESKDKLPHDIQIAFYLIHSMSSDVSDFSELEKTSALNFKQAIEKTAVQQVIYLTGIVNDKKLSKHLDSRKNVEEILMKGTYQFTALRAGIIVGSGSASFEIIRDLVEKLPLMITPKWLNTRSQPIAIHNVIDYLSGVMMQPKAFNKSFDIGGPEVLSYKQMLLKFAKIRGLRRYIFTIPIMTPKLSSYWLYFVTSTSYKLAVNLVNSMKVEVVCQNNDIQKIVDSPIISYDDAIRLAFDKIEQQEVLSSWTDALSGKALTSGISQLIKVPVNGCYFDIKTCELKDTAKAMEKIWSIGGKNGWYYANWLWNFRGFIDKLFGGVGIRRGRRSSEDIKAGESLDFWRVLYANKQEQRLLLYAEMKLPGEAWLDFKIENNRYIQTATFRPLGLWGRLYWFSVLPFHSFIFKGLMNKIST